LHIHARTEVRGECRSCQLVWKLHCTVQEDETEQSRKDSLCRGRRGGDWVGPHSHSDVVCGADSSRINHLASTSHQQAITFEERNLFPSKPPYTQPSSESEHNERNRPYHTPTYQPQKCPTTTQPTTTHGQILPATTSVQLKPTNSNPTPPTQPLITPSTNNHTPQTPGN
jgi:hypothetical protein